MVIFTLLRKDTFCQYLTRLVRRHFYQPLLSSNQIQFETWEGFNDEVLEYYCCPLCGG
jgi:hypothetical protein